MSGYAARHQNRFSCILEWIMKAKALRQVSTGYEPCEASEATHIELHMPGCFPFRIIPVKRSGTGPAWDWNGSLESPTLLPSILTRGGGTGRKEQVCHSFVTDGHVRFLDDCTHEFAGKTVSLLEIEDSEV